LNCLFSVFRFSSSFSPGCCLFELTLAGGNLSVVVFCSSQFDRPRSDKSKISRAIEESRPVSNKSKDFLIQNEKSIKSKDYREFQKNRPPNRSISSEGIKTGQRSNYRGMEPVAQRKPGSERMTETYEAIYEERRTLLEAEVAYKSRIKQLEDESNQFLKTIDDLRSENKVAILASVFSYLVSNALFCVSKD
jgi:hypothetical protein